MTQALVVPLPKQAATGSRCTTSAAKPKRPSSRSANKRTCQQQSGSHSGMSSSSVSSSKKLAGSRQSLLLTVPQHLLDRRCCAGCLDHWFFHATYAAEACSGRGTSAAYTQRQMLPTLWHESNIRCGRLSPTSAAVMSMGTARTADRWRQRALGSPNWCRAQPQVASNLHNNVGRVKVSAESRCQCNQPMQRIVVGATHAGW
jgi:hypothetical protein